MLSSYLSTDWEDRLLTGIPLVKDTSSECMASFTLASIFAQSLHRSSWPGLDGGSSEGCPNKACSNSLILALLVDCISSA